MLQFTAVLFCLCVMIKQTTEKKHHPIVRNFDDPVKTSIKHVYSQIVVNLFENMSVDLFQQFAHTPSHAELTRFMQVLASCKFRTVCVFFRLFCFVSWIIYEKWNYFLNWNAVNKVQQTKRIHLTWDMKIILWEFFAKLHGKNSTFSLSKCTICLWKCIPNKMQIFICSSCVAEFTSVVFTVEALG